MNVCTVCGKEAKGEVCLRLDDKGQPACLISYREMMEKARRPEVGAGHGGE